MSTIQTTTLSTTSLPGEMAIRTALVTCNHVWGGMGEWRRSTEECGIVMRTFGSLITHSKASTKCDRLLKGTSQELKEECRNIVCCLCLAASLLDLSSPSLLDVWR